jgi:peptidoglycan/xylan/chitin deacetylase (PgdA/CDA1 family)
MSSITRVLNAAVNVLHKTMHRKNRRWDPAHSAVSFTFDDFPLTAWEVAGRVLGRYAIRGTYYVSMGMLGKHEAGLQYFRPDTLTALLAEGHELGCHTFHHCTARSRPAPAFFDSIAQNAAALQQHMSSVRFSTFAYPLGVVTLPVKDGCGTRFAASRSIFPGINRGLVDLNLLRAIPLYEWAVSLDYLEKIVADTVRRGGWLVLYTHDVKVGASKYGCSPEYFEAVVSLVRKAGVTILPVGEIATGLA